MILYEAFDKKTGKYYVGITKRTLSQRAREHLRAKGNTNFHNELRKRPDDFKWSIVSSDFNSLEDLLEEERKRIKKRNSFFNGYNGTQGGDYHPSYDGIYRKGRHWSDEEKKMLSERRKGKGMGERNAMANPENRLKVSKALTGKSRPDLIGNKHSLGRQYTEEEKRSISEYMRKNNPMRKPESRMKVSEALRGEKNSYAKRCKIVELNMEFGYYGQCADYLGVSTTAISNAIKYGYKTKGYHIIKI